MKNHQITNACACCGKAFTSYQSQKRRFCSKPCYHKSLVGRSPKHAGAHMAPSHFFSFVDKTGDCWIWKGHINASGYGHISVNGALVLAHRHAYALLHGSIPDGLFILHHCDNPPCVRADHLYAGTKADNARDRSARHRYRDDRGSRHPSAKLHENAVIEIRRALSSGARPCDLATNHGVSVAAINSIGARRTWRHI